MRLIGPSPLTCHFSPSRSPLTLDPHRFPAPPRKPDHVFQRRHRVLIGIGGVHPPAEIRLIGHWQIRRLCPPASAPEGPCRPQQVEPEPWVHHPPPCQPTRQRQPGVGHAPIIIGIFRSL